jgi:circadian clock protein KaiC
LAEFRLLARDELWYRRQLLTLRNRLKNDKCTVIVTEVPSGSGSSLDSLVHGVIELRHEPSAYGPDHRTLRVVKLRGHDFVSGRHDLRIRKGGVKVFPRLVAAEHHRDFEVEQIGTGSPELDQSLKGGLMRGTATLLLGPSGTGKSLLASMVAVAAAERGERCQFFVFDERLNTLLQRADGVGLPLRQHAESGMIVIRQVDPAESSCGEFSHEVRKGTESEGVRLVVIDSLNGYALAMPVERLLSVHLHELISYLSQQGVTCLFTMTQHGLLGQQRQAFDLSYIADTVIVLRHFEHRGVLRKAVSIFKNRSWNHERSVRELAITKAGIEVGPPLEEFKGILSGRATHIGEVPDVHQANSENRRRD